MWLTKIFTALMVILSGLLPSSCTSMKGKSPATQQHAPATTEIATNSKNKNLGELELTNHYETCIQLGAGKSCTIKPNQESREIGGRLLHDTDELHCAQEFDDELADYAAEYHATHPDE